jgi:hypothetical protein
MPQGLPAATTHQNPKTNKKSKTHHHSAARNRKDEHLKQTKIKITKPRSPYLKK